MSGTFQPIPNFVGVNAGQQFREAINGALGGTAPISPALAGASMSGGAATGTSVSQAVAAALITDAADRTIAAWKTDAINFADYEGADPTGATDMSSLITHALTDARAQVKALRFPSGTWGIAANVLWQQGDVILGDGPQSVLKYIGSNTTNGNPAVLWMASATRAISPPAEGPCTILSNIHIVGNWNGTTITDQMTGPMVAAKYCDSVIFDRVFVEYAPNVSINAGWCRRVTAINCKIRYGARDGIQCEGSAMVDVIGGQFDHIDDNVVSNHSSNSEIWGIASGTNIIGIRASDTGGILCAGARRINICNNVLDRPKQEGIGVAYSGEGTTEGGVLPLRRSHRRQCCDGCDQPDEYRRPQYGLHLYPDQRDLAAGGRGVGVNGRARQQSDDPAGDLDGEHRGCRGGEHDRQRRPYPDSDDGGHDGLERAELERNDGRHDHGRDCDVDQ